MKFKKIELNLKNFYRCFRDSTHSKIYRLHLNNSKGNHDFQPNKENILVKFPPIHLSFIEDYIHAEIV